MNPARTGQDAGVLPSQKGRFIVSQFAAPCGDGHDLDQGMRWGGLNQCVLRRRSGGDGKNLIDIER
jgi:hypothetical protein